MNKYIIVSETSADLPLNILQEYKDDLIVLSLSVIIDGKMYKSHPDEKEISIKEVYTQLRNGKVITTSQVGVYDFIVGITPYLEQGFDILYLGFSTGLSGTYNAFCTAANDLRVKFPKRKIVAIDSLSASLGEGLLCYNGLQLKRQGKSLEEVQNYYETNIQKLNHLFTVDDLNFLKRGGRLSTPAAFFGTMLQIKPLMHVSPQGKLVAYGKCFGRKNSLVRLVNKMVETIENPDGQTVAISHGDCLEEALFVERLIRQNLPGIKDVIIGPVGPTIGAHSGPGTIAIFYIGKERN